MEGGRTHPRSGEEAPAKAASIQKSGVSIIMLIVVNVKQTKNLLALIVYGNGEMPCGYCEVRTLHLTWKLHG